MDLECKTIKDILCGLDIQDANCSWKVCRFNDMVSEFCTMTAHFNDSRIWEWFTVGESGIATVQTTFVPKRLYGFYAKWNCLNKPCFHPEKTCSCKSQQCGCDKLYRWHWEQTAYELGVGKYKKTGQKEFQVNMWSCVSSGHVIYSMCPDPIDSVDDEICLPSELMVWFRTYVRQRYAEYDRDLEFSQFYQAKLNRRMELLKANDNKPLYRVYHPIVNG